MKLNYLIALTYIIASFSLSALATNDAFTITHDSAETYNMNTWSPQNYSTEKQVEHVNNHDSKRRSERIIQAFMIYCVIGYLYSSRRHLIFSGLDYSSRVSASFIGILMSPIWPILLLRDGINWFKVSKELPRNEDD